MDTQQRAGNIVVKMACAISQDRVMQALYQEQYGDIYTYKTGVVPMPEPQSCQALVRIHAAALCPLDIVRGRGELSGVRDTFPLIPGYEFAGTIERLGGGICCGLEVGNKVYGDVMRCQRGKKEALLGTVCQYCVVDCDLVGKIPEKAGEDDTEGEAEGKTETKTETEAESKAKTDDLFVKMAATPMACTMAIRGFQEVGLKSHDNLVITHGADEFGLFAIQIAKALYEVKNIATTITDGSLAPLVKRLGATHVVDCSKEDPAEVLSKWADVVVDSSEEIDMEKKMLKENGRHLTVMRCPKGNVRNLNFCPSRKILDVISDLIAKEKLEPIVNRVFPLTEGVKAMKYVSEKQTVGKVVIKTP